MGVTHAIDRHGVLTREPQRIEACETNVYMDHAVFGRQQRVLLPNRSVEFYAHSRADVRPQSRVPLIRVPDAVARQSVRSVVRGQLPAPVLPPDALGGCNGLKKEVV